ncbi:hypothetical protein PMAG_b0072 [Pseudoalteromonas mariniglutinosa NCIMB 1770]|nr:hypothetical protein [Pseudoalteromonas mariniglutinosa NCIMB 1770]
MAWVYYPSVKQFFGFDAAKLIAFNKQQLQFKITQTLASPCFINVTTSKYSLNANLKRLFKFNLHHLIRFYCIYPNHIS